MKVQPAWKKDLKWSFCIRKAEALLRGFPIGCLSVLRRRHLVIFRKGLAEMDELKELEAGMMQLA